MTGAKGFISVTNLIAGDTLRSKVAFEVQQRPDSYVMTYEPLNFFGNDKPIRIGFKSE